MKFVAVFAGVLLAVLVGLWSGRKQANGPHADPDVEANARLTGYASFLLLVPLAAAVITGIRAGAVAHAMVGFLLLPPVLLKLGSVGYRFARYYAGDRRYRAAGPPELVMRLLGPILILSTIALFATGIELWLFGFRLGRQWLTWHELTFLVWFLVLTAHVLAHLRRAPGLALADVRDPLRGALTRRGLTVASLLLGVLLALAMLPFATPFPLTVRPG